MRNFSILALLLLTACGKKDETNPDTDTDTDTDTDADGVALWTFKGSADVVPETSYKGETVMLDVVTQANQGAYNVGDYLCEYVWPATGSLDIPGLSLIHI